MSVPSFTSTYGMLDVEKGRVKLASHLKRAGPVDVLIHATLTEPFGSNDGTSIEFNMNVTLVEVRSEQAASVGTDPEGGDNSLAPFIGDAVGVSRDAQNTPQVTDNEL